ncbi:MAG: SLBB domain-containing protein [Cyanobacteriota bacterium]
MHLRFVAIKIVLVFAALLLAINFNVVVAETSSSTSLKGRVQASPEYVLGAGDVLEVFDYITKENETFPEVIQQVPILPDGTATIIPIGQIKAEGLTLSELNEIVRSELSKTIRHPRIYVSVSKIRPMDVYVIGAVIRPGHYSSDMPGSLYGQTSRSGNTIGRPIMTVTSALEQAGGLKTTANVKNITLYRKRTNEKYTIDLWKLLYEGDTSQDFSLQSGDVIHVSEVNSNDVLSPKEQREVARSTVAPALINVQVMGAVEKPGIYQLPPESDMVAALASAGGPLKSASNNIIIARINPDGSIKKMNLKFGKVLMKARNEEERIKLYPQDLVFVKSSPVKKFANFAGDTAKNLVQGATLAVLFKILNN